MKIPKKHWDIKHHLKSIMVDLPTLNKSLDVNDEVFRNIAKCYPTDADRKRWEKHLPSLRKKAADAIKHCDCRMIKAHRKANPPSKYNIAESFYSVTKKRRNKEALCN